MRDPRIDLKTPWLAALLAFLVPGAGHLYQGRYFKAAVYSVCIIGMFITGMRMSDWRAMYLHHPPPGERLRGNRNRLQFLAQFGVGAPALYALLQNKRYYGEDNVDRTTIDAPMTADFEGELNSSADDLQNAYVTGTIQLEPAENEFGSETINGRLVGTREDGTPIELELISRIELDKPVRADARRDIDGTIYKMTEEGPRAVGALEGTIPRSFLNWFVAPVETKQDREMHARLGKFHELAMVFTWVAGLLNLLVIWDAYDGPAYAYGDETDTGDTDSGKKSEESEKPAGEDTKRTPAEATA
ncbi:MAG: hypothetical protein DWQ34_01400 [Planctomycetota bacterium]|nr:MAG: hypothetical protein DWQ34_01400 [Planctomycetota bacterium]REK26657.1 MAG: hypothetical protein DWQ41_08880 [Planctomycetota bacterium]REK35684.1 MAG: hypothetical protein DWQ45_11075 [Planctomycetota bacterium]